MVLFTKILRSPIVFKLIISTVFLQIITSYNFEQVWASAQLSRGVNQFYSVQTEPMSIAAGDFNADGKTDLVVANRGSDSLSVMLGDGSGGFTVSAPIPAGDDPLAVYIFDLNNDGKPDLVVGNTAFDDGRISVFMGDGMGGFGPQKKFFFGTGTGRITAGDFDRDGRLDLVVGSYYGDIYLFLGDGAGGFSSITKKAIGYQTTWVEAADFNGDGNPDVIVGDHAVGGYKIYLLTGNGSGGFSQPTPINSPPEAFPALITDLNTDGIRDIVLAYPYALGRMLGDGHGGFAPATQVTVATSPLKLEPGFVTDGDFNGDGKKDLALTTNLDSQFGGATVMFGDGAGSFNGQWRYTAGDSPFALAAGDFDRDGKSDLAVTNFSSARVATIFSPPPVASLTDASVIEGNQGTSLAIFHVTISAPLNQPAYLPYQLRSGTASANSDYEDATGTLIIPPGSTSGNITVRVNGDNLYEPDETFTLELFGPVNVTVGMGQATGLIVNDDLPPSVSVNDGSFLEGNEGINPVPVELRLSNPSSLPVSITYATADGTALEGLDYVAKTGTLTFSPGQTILILNLGIIGDIKKEELETFYLKLTNPVNAIIATGQGAIKIYDNDTPAILLQANTERAVALDSVNFVGEPFAVDVADFTGRHQTRIMLFTSFVELITGEDLSSIVVEAEDSAHNRYRLPVEYLGKLSGFSFWKQVNVKLPNELSGKGDLAVTITMHGVVSNKAMISVK